MGKLTEMSGESGLKFFDKDTYPIRPTTKAENIRIVPGGSSIRDGAYIAPSVVCMPPMYINVGAYIGSGTMIDSHALVGACAQVGERSTFCGGTNRRCLGAGWCCSGIVEDDDGWRELWCLRGNDRARTSRACYWDNPDGFNSRLRFDPQSNLPTKNRRATSEIPAGAVVVPGARQFRTNWGGVGDFHFMRPS